MGSDETYRSMGSMKTHTHTGWWTWQVTKTKRRRVNDRTCPGLGEPQIHWVETRVLSVRSVIPSHPFIQERYITRIGATEMAKWRPFAMNVLSNFNIETVWEVYRIWKNMAVLKRVLSSLSEDRIRGQLFRIANEPYFGVKYNMGNILAQIML
jgi:hypothetical protein